MNIFEEEKALASLLDDTKAVAAFSVPLKSIPEEKTKNFITKANISIAHKTDKDLFYIPTVLVTVGCNENDDVFEKTETWLARKTPEDKPFNYEHKESEIIGHIIGNYVVDDDFSVIADETPIEKLPEKFHIVTPSVIYTHWRDEELKTRAQNLIAEINDGLWFVSMEAFFTDFGYMLFDDSNTIQASIARSKETAYLTKYLRAYGGSGKYDGMKIGRVLKNITFSGKGLVKQPANPESIILTKNKESFGVGVLNNYEQEPKNSQNNNQVQDRGLVMATEINEKEIAELKAKVDLLAKERDEAKAKASEAAEQLVKDKLSTLEAGIKVRDESIAELKTKLENSEKETIASNKAKDEAVASVDKLTKDLDAIKAEQIKASRISALEKVGFDTAAATEKYTKFASLSNEMFDELVQSFAAMKSDDKKEDKKDDKKEDDAKAGKIDDVLEKAKPDADLAMADVTKDKDENSVVASLSKYFLAVSKKDRKNKNRHKQNDPEEGDE